MQFHLDLHSYTYDVTQYINYIQNGKVVTSDIVKQAYIKALCIIQTGKDTPQEAIKEYLLQGNTQDAKSLAKVLGYTIPELESGFLIRGYLAKGLDIPEVLIKGYKV